MADGRHIPGVFKTVIAPIQSWLLSQGRCVGCGKELAKSAKGVKGSSTVKCECGRIFVNDSGKYRRALLEEV